MDKIKAFVSDKKNTPIVAAVAGIVLVLVVLFYLKQFGIIGGGAGTEDTYPTDTGTTGEMSTAATPDATATPPVETPSPDGTSTETGSATNASAANAAKIPPMLPYRKDPFMGFSGPPRKQDAVMAILPGIRHMRLAPAAVGPAPDRADVEESMPPQPMRRVAGIMWGTSVKAIIESGGKTHLVKPGDTIPDENVRVERIEPSGVILTTLNTKRPMSIRVNLAGSPMAQDENNPANMGNEAPPPNSGNSSGRVRRGGGPAEEAPPPGF